MTKICIFNGLNMDWIGFDFKNKWMVVDMDLIALYMIGLDLIGCELDMDWIGFALMCISLYWVGFDIRWI